MSSSKIEEIVEPVDEQGDDQEDEHGESDDHEDVAAVPSSSKKKKKKKSKAAKALSALTGRSNNIPQALVDRVFDQVKADGASGSEGATEEHVRQVLEEMKIMDVVKGKAGIGGINKKDLGEHKFWATQPVPQLGEGPPLEDGYIEPSQPRDQVRQEPYALPNDFEWTQIDIQDAVQLKEVYDLLSGHYVEDDAASFRFNYTSEFLKWALGPPGYHPSWHIGVRVTSNKKLVAFISGVPLTLRVRKNIIKTSEINFLCVHKKLRSKRLAPVLIKEVTRQVHLEGIFQAIYTAGVVIPTPLTVCRYNHRPLNVSKLVDIKFSYVPRNMTLARYIRVNKVPESPTLKIREMEEKDVVQVTDLFTKYMRRFDMVPIMSIEDVRHQLLSGIGTGTMGDGGPGRKVGQVTWTYVVEHPESHRITDFFSFYSLPSSVIHSPKHGTLEAAYLFYYATETAINADSEEETTNRLRDLISDAAVVANNAKFDVFNALTLMDNNSFLQHLKFGVGDGHLNYYLYNWRTAPLAGMSAIGTVGAGRGVGVVML
ncbi:N-myristoyl transferase [Mycena floridula]|nr:N-myristoyl transferase [Mycena floridula]